MTPTFSFQSILLALVGGITPALIWLWFWLKEDESSEPKHLLVVAFFGGVLMVPLAFFLEVFVRDHIFPIVTDITDLKNSLGLLVGAAFIEELVKYLAFVLFIAWQKEYDEPADAMIYLITIALGFAAFENVLYLQGPFAEKLAQGFAVINLRFLGATLLHSLSSALLGYFIAGSFFKNKIRKEISLFIGLCAATLLHTLFNLSIIGIPGREGLAIEQALILLIVTGIFILFSFEHVKHKIKKYYA